MLSFLDGLVTESAKKRFEKVQKLKEKGSEAAKKAASEIEGKEHKRFVKHLDARKDTPEVKRGIEKRQAAKQEQKKASHSTQLKKKIDKISDQILARIGSKNPERQEEKKMMKGYRAKLETRLKKVEKREESGARSKREVRKSKKDGPDLG
jgi:hypothetical protein